MSDLDRQKKFAMFEHYKKKRNRYLYKDNATENCGKLMVK